MRKHKIFIHLLVVIIGAGCLTGCAGREAIATAPVITATPAASAAPVSSATIPLIMTPSTRLETDLPVMATPANLTPEVEPAGFPSPPENLTRYVLDARLDYSGHTLAVEEQITTTNHTPEGLAKIPLVVEALRYPGMFQLGKIYAANGERLLQFRIEGTTLMLTLPTELAVGETTTFSLAYTLKLLEVNELPQLRPYPLGYTDLQANFGDWYPFIPPYDLKKGWLAHAPAFYGEHLVYDEADFAVAIHLPEGQESLVVAASAPANQEGGTLRYSHLARRSFAWSVSPYYETATRAVQLGEGESVQTASYYFPYHAEAGKDLLEAMSQALVLYSELFGAYPHPLVTGVQADFIDGMEYDGLFFLSTDYYNWHKDSPEDFLVALSAHETAHQWWMGIVGSDQALEPWLDEALCTYSEALYFERFHPEALEWWWTYRVNYYEPQGWVDMTIYDAPQVVNQYRTYRNPVYLRGALFLEELRRLIGDEAFFSALRAYAVRYAYQQADGLGFWEIVSAQTSDHLSALKAKYFRQAQ